MEHRADVGVIGEAAGVTHGNGCPPDGAPLLSLKGDSSEVCNWRSSPSYEPYLFNNGNSSIFPLLPFRRWGEWQTGIRVGCGPEAGFFFFHHDFAGIFPMMKTER